MRSSSMSSEIVSPNTSANSTDLLKASTTPILVTGKLFDSHSAMNSSFRSCGTTATARVADSLHKKVNASSPAGTSSRAPTPDHIAISAIVCAIPPSETSWAAANKPSIDPATKISAKVISAFKSKTGGRPPKWL